MQSIYGILSRQKKLTGYLPVEHLCIACEIHADGTIARQYGFCVYEYVLLFLLRSENLLKLMKRKNKLLLEYFMVLKACIYEYRGCLEKKLNLQTSDNDTHSSEFSMFNENIELHNDRDPSQPNAVSVEFELLRLASILGRRSAQLGFKFTCRVVSI